METYQIVIAISIVIFVLFFKSAYKEDKIYKEKIKKRLDEEIHLEFNAPQINQDLLKEFESIFLSGKLMDLKIFQVKDFYYHEESENLFIFEGIEFKFNKGFFSIGFSSEHEYNMFQATPFTELYDNENEEEINIEETKKLSNLIGKKVVEVKFKTLDFNEVIDYTMKLEKVSKIVEVILHFENNETLQIATINYDYEKDKPPKNYRYDVTGELLISLNNSVKI
jgi:hypothetical protein